MTLAAISRTLVTAIQPTECEQLLQNAGYASIKIWRRYQGRPDRRFEIQLRTLETFADSLCEAARTYRMSASGQTEKNSARRKISSGFPGKRASLGCMRLHVFNVPRTEH